MMFALLDFEALLRKLKSLAGSRRGCVWIGTEDVFRISRMVYKDGYLIVFFTGYLANGDTYQFYMETGCPLYSYRKCFGTHAAAACYNNCVSYKTMVMPGLRGVHSERINIIKYKKVPANAQHDKFCLDAFLNDVNRVHMQTDLKEGQYVRFREAQKCLDHRLSCSFGDVGALKSLFEVVSPDSLPREIVPVIACYDIETHSNGQRFSNAAIDHIISIALVVRRDNKTTNICLYYMQPGVFDDMAQFAAEKQGDVLVSRFDSELEMIAAFFRLLPVINADFLLDYNGDKFDLPFIIDRVMKARWPAETLRRLECKRAADVLKVQRYDLQPVEIVTKALFDKFHNKMNTHFFTYYTHVDLYQFLSTDSEQNDVENFQLNTVSRHYLNSSKVDLPISEMLQLYNDKQMQRIIEYNVQDCVLPVDIFIKLEIMDFMYTQCALLYLSTDDLLSNISHKVNVVFFYNAINNSRDADDADAAAGKNSVPDPYFFNKYDLSVTSGRKRRYDEAAGDVDPQVVDLSQLQRKPIPVADIPADAVRLCHQKQKCVYTGGKVLSPSPGFKKWVVTLDFNSLYLSIMMQEGICLSNVFIAEDGFVYLVKDRKAINPKLLKTLLDLRTVYKKRRDAFEAGSFQYNLYDKLQNAVKRIANSIYGYFGIFFKPLANFVTRIGREKLMEAIEKIEATSNDAAILADFNLTHIQFKVIYGDTDSSFIQVLFDENEIVGDAESAIRRIINEYVLKNLNSGWVGYKMALENVMSSLILLKKKKYCYLNSENRLKYKGWLVKKDMPLFMRKTFRRVVDSYLLGHSVACGLKLLKDLMVEHHRNFGVDDNYSDYSFSMSYNANPTGKNTKSADPERKRPITIARRCRELLSNSGTDFLPGTGDRIPYLLVDVKGNITQKSFPLKLFGAQQQRVSWIKHVGIMCTFFNELIQVFGNRPEFQYYFESICAVYMRDQLHDVKYPMLNPVRAAGAAKPKTKKATDGDDDGGDDGDSDNDDGNAEDAVVLNHTHQFSLYKKRPPTTLNRWAYTNTVCAKCDAEC
ncbi:DNA polymerase [Peridroma alphabaculovirus]|uniref:DNA-directed DNA polymerase n=1 Tax=Peridroma alphabaculovirus TaxID=1346829 RepID=A0A068LKS3_9ABAC|nr:DNA polymerase [Peridroma alphabaculovirus]AIE47788.1 DNA polymerase [Peridroma alphabaculovirus]